MHFCRELSGERSVVQAHREVINSTVNSLMAHLGIFTNFKVGLILGIFSSCVNMEMGIITVASLDFLKRYAISN